MICTSSSAPPLEDEVARRHVARLHPAPLATLEAGLPPGGLDEAQLRPGRVDEAAEAEGCLAQVGPREGATHEGAVGELRAAQRRVGEVAVDERHVLDLHVLGEEQHERLRSDGEPLVGVVADSRIARGRRHDVGARDVEEREGTAFGQRGDERCAEAGRLLVGHRPPHEHRGRAHHPDSGDALDRVVLGGIGSERLHLGLQVPGRLREPALGLGSEGGAQALGDFRVEAGAPRERLGGRRPRLGVEPRRAMTFAREFERSIGDTRHRLRRRWLVLAPVDGLRLPDRAVRRRHAFGEGVLPCEARLVLRPVLGSGMARHERVVGTRRCERQRHGMGERGREQGSVVESFLGIDPAAHRDLRPVIRIVGRGGGVLHPDDERPDLLPDPVAVGEPDRGAPDGGGDPGGGDCREGVDPHCLGAELLGSPGRGERDPVRGHLHVPAHVVLEQPLQRQGRARVDALASEQRVGLAEHPGVGVGGPAATLLEVGEVPRGAHPQGVIEGSGAEPHRLLGIAREQDCRGRIAIRVAPLRVVLGMEHRPGEVRAHGRAGRRVGRVAAQDELDVESSGDGESRPGGRFRDRTDRPQQEHLRSRERCGGVGDRHRASVRGDRPVPVPGVDWNTVLDTEGEDARDAEHAPPARQFEGARSDGGHAGGDDECAFVIHGRIGPGGGRKKFRFTGQALPGAVRAQGEFGEA